MTTRDQHRAVIFVFSWRINLVF